jgi:malate dehydrogenase (oxaloacetate-decarboxylating)
LTSARLNRGTAFTLKERHQLGLTGRLPSAVLTLEDQAQRLWQQLSSLPTDLARNLLPEQVRNRNEVLYFKVLSEHLPELLPVVYDPNVGRRSSATPMSTAVSEGCICPSIVPTRLPNPSPL